MCVNVCGFRWYSFSPLSSLFMHFCCNGMHARFFGALSNRIMNQRLNLFVLSQDWYRRSSKTAVSLTFRQRPTRCWLAETSIVPQEKLTQPQFHAVLSTKSILPVSRFVSHWSTPKDRVGTWTTTWIMVTFSSSRSMHLGTRTPLMTTRLSSLNPITSSRGSVRSSRSVGQTTISAFRVMTSLCWLNTTTRRSSATRQACTASTVTKRVSRRQCFIQTPHPAGGSVDPLAFGGHPLCFNY